MNCLNAWNRSVRLENLAYVFEILVNSLSAISLDILLPTLLFVVFS